MQCNAALGVYTRQQKKMVKNEILSIIGVMEHGGCRRV